jgi:hypothetical protein
LSFDRNRFDAIPTSPMIRNCLTNSAKLEGEIYFEVLTIVDENVEGELIMNSGLSLMKAQKSMRQSEENRSSSR